MRHLLKHVLVLSVIATGLGASAPAQAASAVGPYYATPAWDQKLDANTRFIVLTNWNSEAVLDRETGIVWERAPSGTTPASWNDATTTCLRSTRGGRMGWRLPSINELTSLVDGLTLPVGHPFNAPVLNQEVYWTATSAVNFGGLQTLAYAFFFGSGGAGVGLPDKSGELRFWCVRSAAVLDRY